MIRAESAQTPVLTLAVGHEFTRTPAETLEPARAQALAEVLDGLHYDAGLLTADEDRQLRAAGVEPPKGWTAPKRPERHDVRLADGHLVAVILLPELSARQESVPEDMGRAAGTLCREARDEADLVVALSTWGLMPERAWVDSLHGDGPDILLGSGPGMELEGVPLSDDRTLWARPSAKGKFVSRLDLDVWPSRAEGFAWNKDTKHGNVHPLFRALNNDILDDPKVQARLAGVSGE
ncbi:MAG: hypothetical protein AB7D57_01835 [Desulfovibrionaceae bacterium]